MRKNITLTLLAGLLAGATGSVLSAADGPVPTTKEWPHWRGQNSGNAWSAATNLPAVFLGPELKGGKGNPISPPKDADGRVRWKFTGAGGHACPVVAQGKVFISGKTERPRDGAPCQVDGLVCLRETDGQVLWVAEGAGVWTGVAVDGNRVYAYNDKGRLICLDIEGQANGNDGPFTDEAEYFRTLGSKKHAKYKEPVKLDSGEGDIVWMYDLMKELGVQRHDAIASVPIVLGDYVYCLSYSGGVSYHEGDFYNFELGLFTQNFSYLF